jgi:hypothetical protein
MVLGLYLDHLEYEINQSIEKFVMCICYQPQLALLPNIQPQAGAITEEASWICDCSTVYA